MFCFVFLVFGAQKQTNNKYITKTKQNKKTKHISNNDNSVESKSIRDSIGDMKDALERIGKRIARANRNLKELHKQFGERVSSVLAIFAALQHQGAKLKALELATEMHNTNSSFEQVAAKRLSAMMMSSPKVSGQHMHQLTDQALADTFNLEDPDMIDTQKTGELFDQPLISSEIVSDSDFDSPAPPVPSGSGVFAKERSPPVSLNIAAQGKIGVGAGSNQTIVKKAGAQEKAEEAKENEENAGTTKPETVGQKLGVHFKMNSVSKVMTEHVANVMSLDQQQSLQSRGKTLREKLNLKNFISSANPFKKKKKDVHPLDRFEKVMTGFHTLATNHLENCEYDYSALKEFAGFVLFCFIFCFCFLCCILFCCCFGFYAL